ncbi:MAG: NUDIX domain-containing protein [Oscillospiraceae bacterium]
MEYFDLYTADRKPLGRSIQRGVQVPRGEYHIVVQIMTVNRKGEILLTQRVPEKTSGGKWECSGGCAVSGETSREAAVRELREETGLRVSTEDITLEWTLTTDSMLRDFYIVTKDARLESLMLQATEVCAAKWVTFERLEEMVHTGQTTRTVAKWLDNRREELLQYTRMARLG